MTKLKKPITLTIETIEDAIGLRLALNVPESTSVSLEPEKKPATRTTAAIKNPGALGSRRKIEEQLTAQGIDWNTWPAESRFKIGDQECSFNPNGTVTFSCGATIGNDEIHEFLKLRKAAMGTGEWPKFYLSQNNVVWRSHHTAESGQWWEEGRWNTPMRTFMNGMWKPANCKPITREEAAAIIGAENLLKYSPRFAVETMPADASAPLQRAPENPESIAATADLFDALKGLYEAVRLLRAETIAMDNSHAAAKSAILKAAR
jgi:hypothetical protein